MSQKGKHQPKQQKQQKQQPRPLTDRDMIMYMRGWNMALRTACGLLEDVILLRQEDIDGLGVS